MMTTLLMVIILTTVYIVYVYADADVYVDADVDHTDHCTRVIPYSCWLIWRVLVLRDSGPVHLVWNTN